MKTKFNTVSAASAADGIDNTFRSDIRHRPVRMVNSKSTTQSTPSLFFILLSLELEELMTSIIIE